MADINLLNDEVLWIPLLTKNAAGAIVAPPASDVDSVTIDDPTKATGVIGVMPSGLNVGAIALGLNALVQVSPGHSATITDTAGLTKLVISFDIAADVKPSVIAADLVNTVSVPQTVPSTVS